MKDLTYDEATLLESALKTHLAKLHQFMASALEDGSNADLESSVSQFISTGEILLLRVRNRLKEINRQ